MVSLKRLNDVEYIKAKINILKSLNNTFDSQYHLRALEYEILTNALNKLTK